MQIDEEALVTKKQGFDSSWVVSNVVDADVHAVCDLRVPFLGRLRVCLLRHLICWDDLAVGVHGDSVGGDLEVSYIGAAMGNSLLGLVHGLALATLAADLLQVVEVALAHGCHVAATEDADFEVLRLLLAVFAGDLGTRPLEIVQGLEDDALGADVAGNGLRVPVVGHQLMRRGEIDTIDVSVAKEMSVLVTHHCIC